MGFTYKCPRCGAVCMSEREAARHCDEYKRITFGFTPGNRECPRCHGTGQILTGLLSSYETCPTCGGRGTV